MSVSKALQQTYNPGMKRMNDREKQSDMKRYRYVGFSVYSQRSACIGSIAVARRAGI